MKLVELNNPNQYIALTTISYVGVGLICLFNSSNWTDWLLKDLTLFGGGFVTLGVLCIVQMMLRIIHSIGIKNNPNYTLTD